MTKVTYAIVGPFTDSNPPGLNAEFFNALEAFLAAAWFDSSITSNGSGVLTVLGLTANGTTTINGNETVSGTLIVSGDVTLSGAGTGLSVSHNALISGNETVSGNLTANGSATFNSGINLPNGSLTRISSFSASVSTTTTSVNHNLGAVPDLVLLSVTGGVSTSRTVCYDPATMTSSQVSLTANSSFTCNGLAIKF